MAWARLIGICVRLIELHQDYFETRVCYIEETKSLDVNSLGPICREANDNYASGFYIKVHNIPEER